MKKDQKAWTRDELILVINLYCRLPFGKLDQRTPEVQELARLIGRTPGAVSFKLNNFASLDPTLKARGIKGAENSSKLDKEIWKEFYNNWETLPFESEKLRAKTKGITIEKLYRIQESELPKGKERQRTVVSRVNQGFFRAMILATYNDTCCITGLKNRELLIASHILPWAKSEANRMNPSNGLALNSLHDKAFELGLLTIDANYRILISKELRDERQPVNKALFSKYHGRLLKLPSKFLPNKDFLEKHKKERFRG